MRVLQVPEYPLLPPGLRRQLVANLK